MNKPENQPFVHRLENNSGKTWFRAGYREYRAEESGVWRAPEIGLGIKIILVKQSCSVFETFQKNTKLTVGCVRLLTVQRSDEVGLTQCTGGQ